MPINSFEFTTLENASQFKAYEFEQADLAQLVIYAPDDYDDADWGGETWANQVCSGFADTLFAPDYEHGEESISVLILEADRKRWEDACTELGCTLEYDGHVEPGHYGDAAWGGADIASCGDKFYWIERG